MKTSIPLTNFLKFSIDSVTDAYLRELSHEIKDSETQIKNLKMDLAQTNVARNAEKEIIQTLKIELAEVNLARNSEKEELEKLQCVIKTIKSRASTMSSKKLRLTLLKLLNFFGDKDSDEDKENESSMQNSFDDELDKFFEFLDGVE